MKKQKNNYSQLERCILETADGQFFIDRKVLLKKVLEKTKGTNLSESDINERLQKLTEQKALSLHTCYALEDRGITKDLLIKTAKIITPIVILMAILFQIYLSFIY